MNIAYLIISHNRITQTKAQMDLIKNLYSKYPLLSNIDLFHAYNGDSKEYPEPYIGEKIIRRENLGHFRGATDLINSGIKEILNQSKKYKYIIVASGDVWFVNPELIENTLKNMNEQNKLLCTSFWYEQQFATEFFIIESSLAEKVFPLDLIKFEKEHPYLYFLSKLKKHPTVEILFRERVALNTNLENDVIFFDGMEHISYGTRWIRKKVKYYSPHDTRRIKKVIKEENLTQYGDMFRKLLSE